MSKGIMKRLGNLIGGHISSLNDTFSLLLLRKVRLQIGLTFFICATEVSGGTCVFINKVYRNNVLFTNQLDKKTLI